MKFFVTTFLRVKQDSPYIPSYVCAHSSIDFYSLKSQFHAESAHGVLTQVRGRRRVAVYLLPTLLFRWQPTIAKSAFFLPDFVFRGQQLAETFLLLQYCIHPTFSQQIRLKENRKHFDRFSPV